MKFKRLISLLIPALALTACSPSEIYGTYSFKLGSTPESMVGIELLLTKEVLESAKQETSSGYTTNQGVYGVKRVLDFHVYSGDGQTSKLDVLTDLVISVAGYDILETFTRDEIREILATILGEEKSNAYYSIDEKITKDKGHRMRIGLSFEKIIEIITDPAMKEFLKELFSTLTEVLLEAIAVSFINGNSIKITLPVSIDDLLYQICWYGIFIAYNPLDPTDVKVYNLNNPEELPAGCKTLPGADGEQAFQDRVGTVPYVSAKRGIDEVQEMNDNFAPLFDQYLYTFRAAHIISLGLQKE